MYRSCLRHAHLLLPAFGLIGAAAACSVDANVGGLAGSSDDGGSGATLPDGALADSATDANGGNDAPPADGGGDAPRPPGDGALGDAAADALPVTDGGCGVAIAQEGAWIDVAIVQQVVPPGGGGTITPGIYALTAMRSYLSGPMGTAQVRTTLVVTGSPSVGAFASLSEIRNATGDFKAQAPLGETDTYQADLTHAIFVTPTCPSGNTGGGQFTATSTSLTLVDDQTATERVYTRLR
jgi:hypothetical protein